MPEFSTRGDLASAIYAALGITEPSSTGKFGDSGPLDGVTSTLADLGITNGVGGGQYGTTQQTTRGQAFTMIARALGLADANTSIDDASAALVNAGIVKGYSNDPNDIGINDPLQLDHLQLLMDRIAPVLSAKTGDGTSIRDSTTETLDDVRETERARTDPAYAAFLAQQGIRLGEVDDEIALRQDLFIEDSRRRSEAYGRATEASIDGIQTDFENRGLFRSGTRMQREADKRQALGFEQEAAAYAAQRDHESGLRALERERSRYVTDGTGERITHETDAAADEIRDAATAENGGSA